MAVTDAGPDWAGCSFEELADGIGQLHGLLSATQSQLFAAVRELSRREEDLAADGCRDVRAWLVARLGLSASTVRQWAATAGALGSLPALSSLFSSGQVSLDQLAPVAKVATPEADAALAATLPGLSAAAAAALAKRAEDVPPDDEAEAHRRRHLRLWQSGQALRLSGLLGVLEGAVVRAALERIAEAQGPDPETGYAPAEVRMADALVELAGAALSADADPDRATVVVHVDADVLATEQGSAETGDGAAVSARAARRAACDARLQVLLRDSRTGSVDLGRTTRSVPPGLSRYLRRRDGGCRFPGCHAKRGVQAHHVLHWADGGPTDRSNLVSLCRRCHRKVHEGRWRVEGDAEGELTFRSPAGRVLTSRPAPLRQELAERFFGPGSPAPPEGGGP
jgi:hypothetical protein